jgi:ABC-2 type transport system permease protein
MLTAIVRKEFTEALRDGRVRVSAGLLIALLCGSLFYGMQQTRTLAAERETARQATRAHWLAQKPKSPHSAAHYGIYAFKPRAALASLDDGVDPYVGVTTWLEAHKQNEFQFRPAQDATSAQRFGALTAATTLQLLVPLFIVLLGFGAFAGERESGTLRQLLSLGVRPATLGAGKALGIAAALGIVLVPATILGALAIVGTAPGDVPRVLILTGAYLLYYLAWVGIALTISATARSSRVALAGCLGVWMVVTILLPRVMTDVVRRLHPTPSAAAFAAAVKQDLDAGSDGHAGEARFQQAVLRRYGVDSVSQLPVSFAGLALEEGERHGNEVFDRHYGALWQTFAQQERAREWATLLSPLMAMRSISMALAGTDVAQHLHFQSAAEMYRRNLMQLMNNEMTVKAKGMDFEYRSDASTWAKVAPFEYEAPSVPWVLARQTLSLALLGVWAAGALVVTWWSVRRMTP